MSVLSGHGIPVNISENLSSLGTQSSGCFSQENLESYIAGAGTGEATMNHAKETEISGTFDMSENDDFMLDQVPPPASTQTFRSNAIQPPATAAASSGFNDTQPYLLVTASGLSEPLIELAEAADRVPPSFNNQVQPNGTSPMRRRSAMLEVSAQSNSSTTRPPLQQTIQPSVAVSSSQQQISSSSSGAARNDKKVSLTKSDPTKIPVARAVIESTKPLVSLYDVEDYFSREITEDKSDGRGYGKRIYLPPAFDKDYFLGDREGVVNSLKRFRNEVHRIQEKSVGSLIEKFRDLSPADYNNQMIHHFGYDKIYSIYDTVKNVYHPYPSPNSPFQKTYVEPVESDDESDDDESEGGVKEKGYKADLDMINVSVSGLKREHENSERDHLGPSSLRQTSVKQVAREKRFCHELFLPLLNAKLTPEIIEFIKDEVTRQLNLKICDLYEDPELLISDKETFEKALGAYLKSEKLIKTLQESRDSLVAFVKENMP